MRDTQPVQTNERGDEVHPAFGRIHASRVSGTPRVLFDSDITHQHTVTVTIETATRKRDLHHDWIHGEHRLIEIEMSEAQWASFVSSMNTSGVPCTIRATETEFRVPELAYEPRLALSMAEVRGTANRLFEEAREAMAAYDALDPKAPAKEKRAAMDRVRTALRNAEPNMTFAAKSLNEHVENTVNKARADIEAIVLQESNRLGIEAGAVSLPELPVGES
jgi:hypothetical protein